MGKSVESLLPRFTDIAPAASFATLAEQVTAAAAWETPRWAAAAILDVEILTQRVVDPCCETGVLSDVALRHGYQMEAFDLYDWDYEGADACPVNFLECTSSLDGASVFMNPPFSLATQFVDHAFRLGARKIVCFQRQAWRESNERRLWWEARPPARTWLCGDRAVPWLMHIPPEDRKNGMQTAHAWYVWERGHKAAEIGGTIWKRGHVKCR